MSSELRVTGKLKIKVCGMRDPDNITRISEMEPDYMGFIFYDKSPRFIGKHTARSIFDKISRQVTKVGVFVDQNTDGIIKTCTEYGMNAVQLHGNESPAECLTVKDQGLVVIKAFALHEGFDFAATDAYRETVDYFLFDAKGELYGGNGMKYNWHLLDNYTSDIPFFLSGGIGPGDSGELKKFSHKMLYAVDINSKFEAAPAYKDVDTVRQFIAMIND